MLIASPVITWRSMAFSSVRWPECRPGGGCPVTGVGQLHETLGVGEPVEAGVVLFEEGVVGHHHARVRLCRSRAASGPSRPSSRMVPKPSRMTSWIPS